MGVLIIGPVDLADSLPPRTPVNRSRTARRRVEGAYNLDGILQDFGLRESFLHVFQSEERCGFVTYPQRLQLEQLEASGDSFSVQTDFFGPEGQTESFNATFDTEQKPLYSPAFDDGLEWLFQIPLLLKPTGG